MYSTGVIIAYDGLNSSIPSGWTRATDYDGKFLKAAAAGNNPGSNGGSATHSHTSPGHSHSLNSHDHGSFTTNTVGSPTRETSGGGGLVGSHYHTGSIGALVAANSGTTAVTYSSVSNNPPFYEYILIKSTGLNSIPNSGVIFNSATSRTGLSFHSSAADKFIRVAGTGQNAGSTGGSTTNTHDISHGHTWAYHTHQSGTTSAATGYSTQGTQTAGVGNGSIPSHTHSYDVGYSYVEILNYSASAIGAETVQPAYKTLNPFKNSSGSNVAPAVNDIAMWDGTIASIPYGWLLCDGTNGTPDMRDKYLKVPATAASSTTGGSNTHSHASSSHSHSSNGTHSHYITTATDYSDRDTTGVGLNMVMPHQHGFYTSSVAATYASSTTSADSTSNEPEYRTIVFIQLQFIVGTNFVKANILRTNESKTFSSKASIVRTESGSFFSKANIGGLAWFNVSANIRQDTFLKRYFYRVYDGSTGSFVASWANEITTSPSFRTVINGGSGEIVVRMNRNFDAFGEGVDVKLNNRVEIWISDREQSNGELLYSGYISGYRPVLQGNKEYIEITVLSYIAELQRYFLRSAAGETTIIYSSYDPANILKDVIDKYRADGGTINYTASSIDLTGTTVSYTFNTSTTREALNKVIELCPVGWYWYVDPSNVIHLHNKNETADHTFSIGKNISSLETWRKVEDMVNRIYFTGGGTLYKKYENTGSITTYGLYSLKYTDSRVTTDATALTMATRILDTKKDPEIRTKIKIVDSNGVFGSMGYDIESIKVGDTMRIVGLKQSQKSISYWDQMEWDVDVWDQTISSSAADVIQIMSVSYTPNYVELEASSRLPEVQKRIEDINRNVEDLSTVDNPTTPT